MDDSTRIIIVTLDEYEVGLIVDAANDVLDIPVDVNRTTTGSRRFHGIRLHIWCRQSWKTSSCHAESG